MLAGETSADAEMALSLAHATGPTGRHAFLRLDANLGKSTAAAVDAARSAGAPLPPLAGLAISVKDLFDIAGQVTTAGSRALASEPAARRDASAVARRRAAGAALIGRTHMTEFAFSGVGLNPHHATPLNVPMALLDPGVPRIPGGSSSGAAVSVAARAAWAALGSDTGGSIRIPAALQGLGGFKKNTARLTSTAGAVPLSTTLDTVCAITHSVRDAVSMHDVLADRCVELAGRPLSATRFAVARTVMQDELDPAVAHAFDQALACLSRAGVHIETVDIAALADIAPLQLHGGFAGAESWAWHRRRLADHEADYDPRLALRIKRGAALSGADYLDFLRERAAWTARMHAALAGFDAVLSPTVQLLAPPIAALEANDAAFFRVSALLLRHSAVVNLLDGCAISLPCHATGSAPVGLRLWSRGLHDDALLDTAMAVEVVLAAARRASA